MKYRVRFEPIDINNKEDFIELYNKLKACMNRLYKDEHHELIPSIRKIYPVDSLGFPLH